MREGLIVGIDRIYLDVVAWGSAGVVDVVILADPLEVMVALDDISIWQSKQLRVRRYRKGQVLVVSAGNFGHVPGFPVSADFEGMVATGGLFG